MTPELLNKAFSAKKTYEEPCNTAFLMYKRGTMYAVTCVVIDRQTHRTTYDACTKG